MRRAGWIGFMLVAIICLIGPWLAPYATDEIRDMPYAQPGLNTWMGTDYLGADVFSRLLSGGQQLLLLACLSVLLAWLTGGLLGMMAAIKGRWFDRILLFIADILLSIPGLLLLTLVVTVSGRGYLAAVIAAILVMLPDIFRLVRAATLQQLQQDYVDVARCRGESLIAILCREIAPNLLPLFSADVGIRVLAAIFILATASFLGLAAQPPQADWGLMIMENRQGLMIQPWATLTPIIALLILLIPLNLSLDGLFTPACKPKRQPGPNTAEAVSSSDKMLDIQQFSLQLPQQVLIKPLSLQLKTGEIVALAGASGSGKSTLLRAALGHFPDTTQQMTGEVYLAGQPLLMMTSSALRIWRSQHVGFVPQDPRQSMMPSQTLGAFLRLMAARRGLSNEQREQQVSHHFQQLGLPQDAEFLQRYPHQISGGQRQRVMVVAALLGYPALLLMDEPTSALDVVSTQAVLHWIALIARAHHMTVLFIAHDLPQASLIADRIIVMANGEAAEQQPVGAFLHSPLSEAGKHLLNAWQPDTPATGQSSSDSLLVKGDGIAAAYGKREVLAPLSFELGRGETLTVAGRSGGGKTTLLRTLAGLHPGASGRLYLHGATLPLKLHKRHVKQKTQLQYIPQNPASSLNPFYRMGALLQRPLQLCQPELNRQQRYQRVLEVIDQVGLEPQLLSRKAAALSGGQQQRVALARALLCRPDVLLCDEVTSAVDGPTRMALVELLQRLQLEQGIALLIVTHDLTLPAQLGGSLMVVDKGGVVEQGSASELLNRPAHAVTRQLIAAAKIKTDTRS